MNVTCLVPSSRGYVPVDESISRTPMRLTRAGTGPSDEPRLNYGHFFRAITQVLSGDRFGSLCCAASKSLARQICEADLESIMIYAEKHGSDYHPARIEVLTGEDRAVFVMNVAVTRRGMARLPREFEVLKRLWRKYRYLFLPQPYFLGDVFLEPKGNDPYKDRIAMFLADWFQGYHEFHLSLDERDGTQKLLLWDPAGAPRHLGRAEARRVYHQAAMILTLYYDVESFEQIFPWHHAAGDFVVRANRGVVDVRLVAARQYAPMVSAVNGISECEALFFFLLNLSLRMRLDRLDGVGSIAWAEDASVENTFHGFAEAVRTRKNSGNLRAGFMNDFVQYCGSLSEAAVADRLLALIRVCDPSAPDLPVIESHLEKHILESHAAFQRLPVL